MILAVALFAAATAAPAPPPMPDAAHLLAFLNRTIAWYDRLDAQAAMADEPTDVLYANNGRQIGRQIVTLTFESAKAEAPMVTTASASQVPANDRMQQLAKRATSAAEQLRREHARLDDLQRQLASAPPADKPRIEAAIAEEQSRLQMAQARSDTVSGMAGFANESGAPTDLPSQIGALEQTVAGAAAVPAVARKAAPSSVVGLISDVIRLSQKESALDDAITAADVLQHDTREFISPLIALLGESRQQADALMNAPDTSDPAELLRRKTALDAVSTRYRQLSAATIPLAKRRILLDSYKANAGRWRAAVIDERAGELTRLLWRAVVLAVLLLLVVAFAVAWRRVTYRYVQDVRRRHHFLLIRRVILLVLVAGIIAATFASDFSSLTTFIGLLTAGIAIAMQDVILSVAGYFVIIGKYGIRVGDRVRISTVNGDVIDVGLVWIYLMELEARGSDQLPTGRIVEFPNSVVFDHSAGIFKQLPGTRFLWHEVSLVVPANSDFRGLQQRMLAAVEGVFGEYRQSIEQQHRESDRLLGMATETPRPQTRLGVAAGGGIEIRVRYPVEIRNAGDIDDRVAAAITETAQQSVTPPRAVAR